MFSNASQYFDNISAFFKLFRKMAFIIKKYKNIHSFVQKSWENSFTDNQRMKGNET